MTARLEELPPGRTQTEHVEKLKLERTFSCGFFWGELPYNKAFFLVISWGELFFYFLSLFVHPIALSIRERIRLWCEVKVWKSLTGTVCLHTTSTGYGFGFVKRWIVEVSAQCLSQPFPCSLRGPGSEEELFFLSLSLKCKPDVNPRAWHVSQCTNHRRKLKRKRRSDVDLSPITLQSQSITHWANIG